MARKCSGPKCDREAVADGLCGSHFRQRQRGRPLTPLRAYRSGAPKRVVSLRLTPLTADAVNADRAAAETVLNRWATRR